MVKNTVHWLCAFASLRFKPNSEDSSQIPKKEPRRTEDTDKTGLSILFSIRVHPRSSVVQILPMEKGLAAPLRWTRKFRFAWLVQRGWKHPSPYRLGDLAVQTLPVANHLTEGLDWLPKKPAQIHAAGGSGLLRFSSAAFLGS